MNNRTRLVLALMFMTLLPFLGLLAFIQYSNNQQIQFSGASAQLQAEAVLDTVERDFKRAVSEVRSWTVRSDISRSAFEAGAVDVVVLEARWNDSSYASSQASSLLKELQHIGGDRFAEIFYTDPRGNVVASTSPTTDFGQGPESDPPDGEPWWAQAHKERIRLGELTRDASAGIYSVDISIALRHEGHFAGVLKAVYNVESLLDIMGKSTIGQSGHAILVDSHGDVIAAPHRLGSIIFKESSNVKDFAAFRLAEQRTPGFSFEHVPWVGQAMVGVASNVDPKPPFDRDWTVFVIVPAKEALFSSRQSLWAGALILGLVGAVVLGFALVLSARVMKTLVEVPAIHLA